MSKAILTDVTKCIGCLECVSACKKTNDLEMDVPRVWQKNDGLSLKTGHRSFRSQINTMCVSNAAIALNRPVRWPVLSVRCIRPI